MNTSQQAWSRPGTVDPMAQMSNELDDLGNLFEFGDIDLNNISSVDATQYGDPMQQQGTHPNTPFNEISEAQALVGSAAQDFGAHGQYALSQAAEHAQQQHEFPAQAPTSHPYSQEPVYQPSVHSYHPTQQFHFQGMQGYSSTQHVPPTPNSLELHGEVGRFLQQQIDPQQRALLEQGYQLRKEDAMVYTPMVSPAGTPQYNVPPDYTTIPGAYFSPLTSPMLHAQSGQHSQQHHHQGYYTNPSSAPSSNATSPLEQNIDVDMLGEEMSLGEAATASFRKSTRRKVVTPRSAGPLARVRQSPIQKAVKRKSGTMLKSLVPPKESDASPEASRSGSAHPPSAGLQMLRNDSSQDGSISPEPLSEALMAPPPRPGSSVTPSPAISGEHQDASNTIAGKAATPKTILSMRSNQHPSAGERASVMDDQMDLEDLELPAAAAADVARRPSLPQIDTRLGASQSSENKPGMAVRKTPKLGASSTPVSARPPSSALASPSIVGSPMTASTPGALLKDKKASDFKVGRGSKKRGSISASASNLVSPAIRPKISPSIKPLLPEGAALHSPQHALMLASKSNYQNLLEGNQLPGVSYPESLSTGLTSKRTSHKVAEQGRRNRINEALKEMQSLLPKSAASKSGKDNSNSDGSPDANTNGDSKESKEDATTKSNNSKAATVESANEYIRKLQKEIAAMQRLKQENEEMKRKLESIDEHVDTTRSPSAAKSVSPTPAEA